jgi:hypothetical protein
LPPRLAPDLPFPPYAFVPGRHPHPLREATGDGASAPPSDAEQRHAVDLFNHGYYWEAHEVWEAWWHIAGRHSAEGRLLQGLIGLAAAGVKAREGNARGVVHHAYRAREIFQALTDGPPVLLGFSIVALVELAQEIAKKPRLRRAATGAPPEVVFQSALAFAQP